jgi:hypothetical protein
MKFLFGFSWPLMEILILMGSFIVAYLTLDDVPESLRVYQQTIASQSLGENVRMVFGIDFLMSLFETDESLPVDSSESKSQLGCL